MFNENDDNYTQTRIDRTYYTVPRFVFKSDSIRTSQKSFHLGSPMYKMSPYMTINLYTSFRHDLVYDFSQCVMEEKQNNNQNV